MLRRWTPLALMAALAAPPVEAAEAPRLAIVLVVDQLGSIYLSRYGAHLRGGLARLGKQGAYYPHGVHAIANSATGPGHANLATGAWPSTHGIVSNKWSDPETGREVYCTSDPVHSRGPGRLMAPTLADALKLATNGAGRVVSIAGKDRAAILLGGARPDVAVWYDHTIGQFVGGAYLNRPTPGWVGEVNLSQAASPVFGQSWDRLRKDLDYARIAGPDDSPHEDVAPGIGGTFPRRLGDGLPGPDAAWFHAFSYSPPSTTALFELAKRALEHEELGRDSVPDLLSVAVSTLDFVGHAYGPESQEAFDTVLRIDAAIGEFMQHVEAKLGRDAVLWVLSADHGVSPTPERAQRVSGFGHRYAKGELEQVVNEALAKHPAARAKSVRVSLIYGPELFLSPGGAPSERLEMARVAADAVSRHPAVAEAHAHADVARFSPEFRPYYERLIFPGRTAAVFFRPRAGHVEAGHKADGIVGSNHGTPYTYDTHVPIYLAGPGVRRGVDRTRVHVTQIAPSVAAVLKIDPPAAALEDPLPAILP